LNGCAVVDRAATQRRDAAYRELHEKGYGDTTIAGVAEAVGVFVQTIYKSFGSKATLAKRVYDVTLVGDEDSIPLAERPEIQAIIAEPEHRRKLAMYAALGRKLIERVGPLAHVLLSRAKSLTPSCARLQQRPQRNAWSASPKSSATSRPSAPSARGSVSNGPETSCGL
jgi:AcrR family transcriptional regulator